MIQNSLIFEKKFLKFFFTFATTSGQHLNQRQQEGNMQGQTQQGFVQHPSNKEVSKV